MSTEGLARIVATGRSWLWDFTVLILDWLVLPVVKLVIGLFFIVYRQLTWYNAIIFTLKYVPTGLYTYKTLKSMYQTSRERLQIKQMELDDIKLQIQIENTKLCVRDAEFRERSEQLRRNGARLRELRVRLRRMIAGDDSIRALLQRAAEPPPPADTPGDSLPEYAPEEEREFMAEFLKELNTGDEEDKFMFPTQEVLKRGDCGEFAGNPDYSGNEDSINDSVYSSIPTEDANQECRVKIVKITNVYRVACLKHYIKQKRLRRATQQAALRKKVENIKNLLESWQKSLNAVIYSKISRDHSIDLASQEAMGDCSKQFREFSDSDSELKTSCTDVGYDEYNHKTPNLISFDDVAAEPEGKQMYDYVQRRRPVSPAYDYTRPKGSFLFILPEETYSQIAVEENESTGQACSF